MFLLIKHASMNFLLSVIFLEGVAAAGCRGCIMAPGPPWYSQWTLNDSYIVSNIDAPFSAAASLILAGFFFKLVLVTRSNPTCDKGYNAFLSVVAAGVAVLIIYLFTRVSNYVRNWNLVTHFAGEVDPATIE